MKVLSLFDGISGLQQAFKNLGVEFEKGCALDCNEGRNLYLASEIDKYAIQITQKNFPNTIQLGDVKTLSFIENNEDELNPYYTIRKKDNKQDFEMYPISKIDLLSFGFPCQDLSCAKKNPQGLKGERSGLFYEALRIINNVKPKFFIAENVASMQKPYKELITKELWGIKPIMIDSAKPTAQTRKRLYWIGKLQEDGTYKQVEITQPEDRGIYLKDILESGLPYTDKAYAITASYYKAIFWNSLTKKQRTMIAEPLRLGHFNKGGQADRIYSVQGKSVCLSANGGGRGAKTGLYKIDLPDGDYIIRKLTPIECERLQGFPDNFSSSISATQRCKALGNSFTVPAIEHILKHLINQL